MGAVLRTHETEGGFGRPRSAFFSGPIYVDPKTATGSWIYIYPSATYPRRFCFISPLRHRLSFVGVGIALPWCRCLVGVGVRGEMLVVLVKHMGKYSPNKRKTGWLRMTDHATCDPVQCPPFFGCRYTAPLIQRTHESNQIAAPSPLHGAKLTDETAV